MKWLTKARAISGLDVSGFEALYAELATLQGWSYQDYQSWRDDWLASPRLTIDCLKALKNCWDRGGNGCLTQEDWSE